MADSLPAGESPYEEWNSWCVFKDTTGWQNECNPNPDSIQA